jgi:hypothetical protein
MSRWGSRRNQKSNRLVVETDDDEDYDPNRSVSYDVSSTGASTGYVPPTRFGAPLGLHSAEDGQVYAEEEEYYVSGPPRHRTLTGNISSLFRRSSSRERQPATAAMSSPGRSSRRRKSTEDPTTPSAALAHMPHRSPRTSTTSTSTIERQSLEQSPPERPLAQRSAFQDDTLELEPIHAVGFILMASSSLLILFYFKVRTNGNVETKRNESNRRSAVPDRTDISFSPRCISLLDLCHRQSLLCLWM